MKHFAWFAVLGLFCGACSKETEAIVEGTRVGNLAPEIQGEDASGKKKQDFQTIGEMWFF